MCGRAIAGKGMHASTLLPSDKSLRPSKYRCDAWSRVMYPLRSSVTTSTCVVLFGKSRRRLISDMLHLRCVLSNSSMIMNARSTEGDVAEAITAISLENSIRTARLNGPSYTSAAARCSSRPSTCSVESMFASGVRRGYRPLLGCQRKYINTGTDQLSAQSRVGGKVMVSRKIMPVLWVMGHKVNPKGRPNPRNEHLHAIPPGDLLRGDLVKGIWASA